jgi:hypothetical protein
LGAPHSVAGIKFLYTAILFQIFTIMTTVTIIRTETTPMGDMAEVILDRHIEPGIGMILIDEDSQTWEITATLHDASRTTDNEHARLWTLQCKPVNSDEPIHPGVFKLMH